MVSKDTKVTASFVVVAVVLWLFTRELTDSFPIQGGVLLIVGVILPTLYTQYAEESIV